MQLRRHHERGTERYIRKHTFDVIDKSVDVPTVHMHRTVDRELALERLHSLLPVGTNLLGIHGDGR